MRAWMTLPLSHSTYGKGVFRSDFPSGRCKHYAD